MTPCDGTPTSKRWCCGDSDACCTNMIGVVELPEKFVGRAVVSSSSSSSVSSATATSGASQATASAPGQSNSSSPPPEPAGLSGGAKAGIAIGAILGALLLLGAVFFVRKALAWKKQARSTATTSGGEAAAGSAIYAKGDSPYYHYQQHQSQDPVANRFEAADGEVRELGDTRAQNPSELHEFSQPAELEFSQPAELPSYSPLASRK